MLGVYLCRCLLLLVSQQRGEEKLIECFGDCSVPRHVSLLCSHILNPERVGRELRSNNQWPHQAVKGHRPGNSASACIVLCACVPTYPHKDILHGSWWLAKGNSKWNGYPHLEARFLADVLDGGSRQGELFVPLYHWLRMILMDM